MKQVTIFALGAAVGSLITWKIMKNKYEVSYFDERDRRANEEPEDNTDEWTDGDDEEPEGDYEDEEEQDYVDAVESNGYNDISDEEEKEDEEDVERLDEDEPYIITPDEFGEIEDFERITLIYYADGVLADDNDEVVEDIGEVVVEDFADHFGEYEDDSVFVRNNRLECDYEILRDEGKYSDLPSVKYHNYEDD